MNTIDLSMQHDSIEQYKNILSYVENEIYKITGIPNYYMQGNDIWIYKEAGRTGEKMSKVRYYIDYHFAPWYMKPIIWVKMICGAYKKYDK